jgi:hypothetical protein
MHVELQARRYNKAASSNRGVFFALPLVGQDPGKLLWIFGFLLPCPTNSQFVRCRPGFWTQSLSKKMPARQIFPLEDIGTLFAYLHNRK